MRGRSVNEIPGGLRRFGPPHETGLARSLHCGSVKILRPSIWIKRVAWPIQVTLGLMSPARRAAPSLATRGASKLLGAVKLAHSRRVRKLQRVQVDGR